MSSKVYNVNAKGWIKPPMSSSVHFCNSRNCLCCKTLNVNCIFKSFTTGCSFAFINSKGITMDCKSSFIIYLISCIKCGRQYVGQTRQALHKRLNGHRSSIINNKLSTYLCQHFNSNGHSFDDVSIQIIDHVDTSSISQEDAICELNSKEDYYMRVLNTFFPIGLNDRVQGGGCISKNTQQNSLFYCSPITRRNRGHGVRRSRGYRKSGLISKKASEVLDHLKSLFQNGKFSDFYKKLRSIKNDILKSIYKLLFEVNSDFSYVFTSFFFWHFGKSKDCSSPSVRATLVISLNCRKIDLLNIPSIVTLIPVHITDTLPFRIFYKLRPPISLQFCNYSKFLKELSLELIKSICERDCVCHAYKDFVYEHYGHVFTGNLELIQDPDLRNVFKFGAKFRMNNNMSWDKVLESLEKDFELNTRKLARKYKVTSEDLRPWYNKVIEKVKDRISHFQNKGYRSGKNVPLSSFSLLKAAAASLHENFIVSTVDKASNNFAFVCKKFYLTVLLNELGFDDNLQPIGNVTYSPIKVDREEIIDRHNRELTNLFKIGLSNENKVLPRLFWIPKLHKNPFKFRFIAGARNCTTKPLAVIVNLGLKVIKENFRKYCDAIFCNSGYNYFWSISSTLEFIHKINN